MKQLSLIVLVIMLVPTVFAQSSWTRVNPRPTGAMLNGIHFVDSMNVWAVGSQSTVIHSTDGGLTWNEQILPQFSELQKVIFTTPQHGVIVGGRRRRAFRCGSDDNGWRPDMAGSTSQHDNTLCVL